MTKKNEYSFAIKPVISSYPITLIICFCLLIIAGCRHAAKQEQPTAAASADSIQEDFFPVTSFLQGQLVQLDSLQVTPLKLTTKNSKTDSAWIKIADLKPLLKDFTSFEINQTNMLPFFKESKFNDESTEAITFTYAPKSTLPDSISVRKWDIYVTPSTGRVKRVYIVIQLLQNGKHYTQQLTWQTDISAHITTILDLPGGTSEIVNDTKFIWGF